MKALIIGAGVVGDATGYALQRRGWDVVWHDPPKALTGSTLGVRVALLCVPTPVAADGSCDTSIIERSMEWLRSCGYKGAVGIRSTVIMGTGDRIAAAYPEMQVFSWPEFLRDRNAREMAAEPAYMVVGIDTVGPDRPLRGDVLAALLGEDNLKKTPTIICTRAGAEFAKYATNCLLAASVGVANELAGIAATYGLDWNALLPPLLPEDTVLPRNIVVTPEGGYGGKCLPKDVSAFCALHGPEVAPLLNLVHTANLARRPEEYPAELKQGGK